MDGQVVFPKNRPALLVPMSIQKGGAPAGIAGDFLGEGGNLKASVARRVSSEKMLLLSTPNSQL